MPEKTPEVTERTRTYAIRPYKRKIEGIPKTVLVPRKLQRNTYKDINPIYPERQLATDGRPADYSHGCEL